MCIKHAFINILDDAAGRTNDVMVVISNQLIVRMSVAKIDLSDDACRHERFEAAIQGSLVGYRAQFC
jgi:hypothetical protein